MIHYIVTNAHHAHELAERFDWVIQRLRPNRWAVFIGLKDLH